MAPLAPTMTTSAPAIGCCAEESVTWPLIVVRVCAAAIRANSMHTQGSRIQSVHPRFLIDPPERKRHEHPGSHRTHGGQDFLKSADYETGARISQGGATSARNHHRG